MKEKPNVCLFLGCLELKDILDCLPSEEFELTANSLGADIETHRSIAHFEDTPLPHRELTR